MVLPLAVKNSRFVQYAASLTAASMGSSAVAITTWSSPAIAKLTSGDSPFDAVLSNPEASWVVSVSFLTFVLGAIVSAPAVNKFGPKRCLLCLAFPTVAAWFVVAFTKSVGVLIAMRCVLGIVDGFVITVLPIYLGEIADKDIRGKLTTSVPIMIVLQNIFVLSVGPFVSYVALTMSCAVVPTLFIAVFAFMPESPYFLHKKERIKDRNRVLRRLLPNNIDEKTLDDQLKQIELNVTAEGNEKFVWKTALSDRSFRSAILLGLGIKLLMQFSGKFAIKSYLQTIIRSSDSSISPEISSIIFGAAQLPSVLLTAFLVDKMGRRPLYIISAVGSAIALFSETIYFYFEQNSPQLVANFAWWPTLALTVYLIFAPIGLNSLQYVLLSEIFASNVKSAASSFCTTVSAPVSFIVIKLFAPLSEQWGVYTMFCIFACGCCLAALFGIYVMPETKGKSFLEIQKILKKKTFCSF